MAEPETKPVVSSERRRLLIAVTVYGVLWGLTALRGTAVAKDHVSIRYAGSREIQRVEEFGASDAIPRIQLDGFALAPFLVNVQYACSGDGFFGGSAGTALVLWLPLRSWIVSERVRVYS